MPFKFNLSDRVTVKTADLGCVEGVVSGAKTMLNSANEYDVHYLLPDLSLAHIVVPEDVLSDMQPPATVTLSHARDMVDEAVKHHIERQAAKRRRKRR